VARGIETPSFGFEAFRFISVNDAVQLRQIIEV
jgi:hypothetical protein